MISYLEWCNDMERRYDIMPPWYWDETLRRSAYEGHIAALSMITTIIPARREPRKSTEGDGT